MNTWSSTASKGGVEDYFFKEINAETWQPVLWVFLGANGRVGERFSWTRSSIYGCPVFRGLVLDCHGRHRDRWRLLVRRPNSDRDTFLCDEHLLKHQLAAIIHEWANHLVDDDRIGRKAIDGVPWHLHAISDATARRAAVLEYLRARSV